MEQIHGGAGIVFQFDMEEGVRNSAAAASPEVDVLAILAALVADSGNGLVGYFEHIHHPHPLFKRNIENLLWVGDE